MLFSEAKIRVARSRGDAPYAQRLGQAGDAIQDAIRTWSTDWNWSFKKRKATGQLITAGNTDLAIPGFKTARMVRMTSPVLRKLEYFSAAYLGENVDDPSETGDTISYDEVSSGGGTLIRIFRASTADITLEVDYFADLTVPTQDDEALDIPDRWTVGLLDLARYYYLRDFTAEQTRADRYERNGMMALAKAKADDRRRGGEKARHKGGTESQYPGFVESDPLVSG